METIPKESLKHCLLEECYAMVEHLSAEGKTIPVLASPILQYDKKNCGNMDMTDEDVLKLHNELSKKVAPARPKTILLFCKESQKKSMLNFLGPVNLVKRLMFVALTSLILFIIISLSEDINDKNIQYTIFEKSGFSLFIILSFYITSASLGAAFSNLFQANKHITNNTFDPKYENSYWIRFVLGVIAGFLLAVIIPMPEEFAADNKTTNIEIFGRPLLAMLGGFSAALVYRILFRMVYAVESVFIGKQSDVVEQKITNMKSANEMDKENERQKLVNQLLALQGQINTGKTPEEISKEIQNTISRISG
jgi:hypothetical protein